MKRTAQLLLLIGLTSLLALSGCKLKEAEPSKATLHLVDKPVVINHSSYNGRSWTGLPHKLQGDSLVFPGEGFSVEFVFNETLDAMSIAENVLIEGYKDPHIIVRNNTLHIALPKTSASTTYTVHLRKGLRDHNGVVLGRDMLYKLEQVPHTKAYFTLVDIDGVYENIGEAFAWEFEYEWVNQLTASPKTFRVDFTQNVNKKSVESAVTKCLGDGVTTSFLWLSDRKLEFKCENFGSYQSYKIEMGAAMDTAGFNILGGLYFTTAPNQQVKAIHIDSMDTRLIKEFSGKIYKVKQAHSLGSYVLLTDQSRALALNLHDGALRDFANLPSLVRDRLVTLRPWHNVWLTPETLLYNDHEQGKIMSISLDSSLIEDYFKLSDIHGPYVQTMALSPSKDKLAVITEENFRYNVYVYSKKGQLLYRETAAFEPIGYEMWLYNTVKVAWMDERHIVFEDRVNNQVQVFFVDTATGERGILSPMATAPEVLGVGIVKYESYDDKQENRTAIVAVGKNAVELGEAGPHAAHNFCLVRPGLLAYNNGADIVLYDLGQRQMQVVARGELIGASADGQELYYVIK